MLLTANPVSRLENGLRSFMDRHTPEVSYCNPDDPLMKQMIIRSIELVTGQPRLQRIYDDYQAHRTDEDDFWQSAIKWLSLSVNYDQAALDAIPSEGPLVLVANHPFGILDGIAIGHMTSLIRKDVKLLAHASLGRATEFRPYLIPIEFEGASSALRSNVASKQKAMRHLNDGGALIIFPAGRVSTAPKVFGEAVDAPWKLFAGKLVATSGATVVPIYFEGKNSLLFHFVSLFHERLREVLREALILREVARRIGSAVNAHIGSPIPYDEVQKWSDRQALLDYLRDELYRLAPAGPGQD